jgi:hypothetical protein
MWSHATTAPATVFGLKAAQIVIGEMREFQSTAEGTILIETRHLSEKTAVSKLTISQETCHI